MTHGSGLGQPRYLGGLEVEAGQGADGSSAKIRRETPTLGR